MSQSLKANLNSEMIPTNMRALLYSQPRQTLDIATSWPVPKANLKENEYLIKVNATAITNGELTWPFPTDAYRDYSPGVEMAGVIVASPPNPKFAIGSKVYLRITSPRCGAARDYTIGLEHELASMPENLTPEQAASVPVSALTAWQALFVQAGYTPDLGNSLSQPLSQNHKKILILGASGSVGVWATQIARAAGFWVAGSCHTRNVAFVRNLGAHEVIDYTKFSIRKWLEDNSALGTFDLVLDCVGGGNTVDGWYAANPECGLLLSIVAPSGKPLKWVLDRPEDISPNIQGRFFIMESRGDQLQYITKLIEAGKLRPVVDSVFELEDYKKAFQRVESGNATGKVVFRVQ